MNGPLDCEFTGNLKLKGCFHMRFPCFTCEFSVNQQFLACCESDVFGRFRGLEFNMCA